MEGFYMANKKVEIAVKSLDYFTNKKGIADCAVTEIYIAEGGVFFPDRQWSDLTSVVLGHWTYNLINAKKEDVFLDLPFFDGNYGMKVVKKGNQLQIKCTSYTGEKTPLDHSFMCDYCDMLEALKKAWLDLYTLIKREGPKELNFNPMIDGIKRAINEIEVVLREQKHN